MERFGKDFVCHYRDIPCNPNLYAHALGRDNACTLCHVLANTKYGPQKRFQYPIFSERYYATAIYRLSPRGCWMLTNSLNVVMFQWAFEVLWEIKGEQYVIASPGMEKRNIAQRWVIEVFPGRKLMGPDGKWSFDFDGLSFRRIPIAIDQFFSLSSIWG